jgi:hypothetical protein
MLRHGLKDNVPERPGNPRIASAMTIWLMSAYLDVSLFGRIAGPGTPGVTAEGRRTE